MPELHKFREDDAEINTAIAEAQRRYEEFVAALIVDSLLPVGRKQIKGALVKARFIQSNYWKHGTHVVT